MKMEIHAAIRHKGTKIVVFSGAATIYEDRRYLMPRVIELTSMQHFNYEILIADKAYDIIGYREYETDGDRYLLTSS